MKHKKTLKDFTLHIGLNSDDEVTQLITVDGWHVANIEHYPHREIAELIVKSVNAHEKLVEALKSAELLLSQYQMDEKCWHGVTCCGDCPPCTIGYKLEEIRAALALAEK